MISLETHGNYDKHSQSRCPCSFRRDRSTHISLHSSPISHKHGISASRVGPVGLESAGNVHAVRGRRHSVSGNRSCVIHLHLRLHLRKDGKRVRVRQRRRSLFGFTTGVCSGVRHGIVGHSSGYAVTWTVGGRKCAHWRRLATCSCRLKIAQESGVQSTRIAWIQRSRLEGSRRARDERKAVIHFARLQERRTHVAA